MDSAISTSRATTRRCPPCASHKSTGNTRQAGGRAAGTRWPQRRYGVSNVMTSSNKAGACARFGKTTHSRCSSRKRVRLSHGSEGQLCFSDRISPRCPSTQLPQGVQSHHPSPLLTGKMQTKMSADSSRNHPSGSPHKSPWPAAVSKSMPTRHRAPPQPHPRIIQQRPPVRLVPGKLLGGPAQAPLQPPKTCMTFGGSAAIVRGTQSTHSNMGTRQVGVHRDH